LGSRFGPWPVDVFDTPEGERLMREILRFLSAP